MLSLTGNIGPVASAKILKNNKLSSYGIPLFDEIYIQRCEEYSDGASYGVDEDDDRHNGVVCFFIVGLTRNIPYVLHSIPKQNLINDWLKDSIWKSIEILQEIGFHVKGVVCDKHVSNVSAYR